MPIFLPQSVLGYYSTHIIFCFKLGFGDGIADCTIHTPLELMLWFMLAFFESHRIGRTLTATCVLRVWKARNETVPMLTGTGSGLIVTSELGTFSWEFPFLGFILESHNFPNTKWYEIIIFVGRCTVWKLLLFLLAEEKRANLLVFDTDCYRLGLNSSYWRPECWIHFLYYISTM